MRLRFYLGMLAAMSVMGCSSIPGPHPIDEMIGYTKQPMRTFETKSLRVNYPSGYKDQALAIAARIESCIDKLDAKVAVKRKHPKALVNITPSNFNNAYAAPAAGAEARMTMATQYSLEIFNLFNLSAAGGDEIGCHEAAHYVQARQVGGFWRGFNYIFGPALPPQAGFEPWFAEGLATYYEARLEHTVGRPRSPLFTGAFEAEMAGITSSLGGANLNINSRHDHLFGVQYLVGQHFIAYLVEKYGEEKLWKLIEKQGRSILFLFGNTLRFKSVYGKSIGALLADFDADWRSKHPVRPKPAGQGEWLARDISFGRLASSPDGRLAILSDGRDEETSLEVVDANGQTLFKRNLVTIRPGGDNPSVSVKTASGLSFTGDGKWIYLVLEGMARDTDAKTELWKIDAQNGNMARVGDTLPPATGGSVLADGSAYLYTRQEGSRGNIVRLDFETGRHTMLTDYQERAAIGNLSPSPDGRRLAFTRRDKDGFQVFVADLWEKGLANVRMLTSGPTMSYGVRWRGDEELVFVRAHEGRWQVHTINLPSTTIRIESDAPYVAFDAVPLGRDGKIAFLNAYGNSQGVLFWSLDTISTSPSGSERTAANASTLPTSGPAGSGSVAPFEQPQTAPPVEVLSDRPYSEWDGLLIPSTRAPKIGSVTQKGKTSVEVGAVLGGKDRLGINRWALGISVRPKFDEVDYLWQFETMDLAPLSIAVALQQLQDSTHSNRTVLLEGSRPFYRTTVALNYKGTDFTQRAFLTQAERRLQFYGPGYSWNFGSGSGTGVTTRRVLGFGMDGSFFASKLGSDRNMADLSEDLYFTIPLPISKRHSLSFQGRSRGLLNAPAGMLSVGGSTLDGYENKVQRAIGSSQDSLLSGSGIFSFSEGLRGFDDAVFRTNNVYKGEVTYRYPFIVDRGTASTLYVLGGFLLQQFDFELYGSGAYMWESKDKHSSHLATGAALKMKTLAGPFPLTLVTQHSYRATDKLGYGWIVGLEMAVE